MSETKVKFKLDGMTNFLFKVQDYRITDGKKWDGIKSYEYREHKECILNIEADKQDTETVAKWFSTQAGASTAIGCDTATEAPKTLHYAFTGTMEFTYKGKDYKGLNIVMGCGTGDTWWIGGTDMNVYTRSKEASIIEKKFELQDAFSGDNTTKKIVSFETEGRDNLFLIIKD